MIDCGFAKCVTSGDGFEEGFIYPILGTNNGIHIMREKWAGRINDPGGDSSDPYDFIACTGGVGDGLFNNFDGSGKPSFIPADVRENVKGEWIESMHRVCGDREYKCSNCNKVIWSGAIDRYHFCPNCGADMRGEA